MALTACAPASSAPTATPTPVRTATPIRPTATPTLAADLAEPQIVQGPDGASWIASRLINQSSHPVSGLEVQFRLFDNEGRQLGEVLTTPNPPILSAGGQADVLAPAPANLAPVSAAADLEMYQPIEDPPVELDLALVEIYETPQGGSRLIGTIQHKSNRPLTLTGLSVLAEGQGIINALPELVVVGQQLPANRDIYWSATFDQLVEADQISLNANGLPASTDFEECQVQIEAEPGLQVDPQGNHFFTGVLQNQQNFSCQARVLLLMEIEGQPVDLVAIDSPIPLAAAEERPFGLRWQQPGLGTSQEFEVRPQLETQAARSIQAQTLELQLTAVENLGSNLILRGLVINQNEVPARHTTVFGSLRSTEGKLLTAGWQQLPAELAVGESSDFVLLLPLTEDIEVNNAEFDLRALALTGETSSNAD